MALYGIILTGSTMNPTTLPVWFLTLRMEVPIDLYQFFSARGSWLVVRGLWFVVRGS